ncbi:MAG: sensor domain-containing diguanylate cyclase [Sulfurovum sp.]|uniref:sensor domain-containing diguanylate cyclase n=1 Tax=Sulfurovum sp. TaxID=1969726 RepID=UPI00286800BF|nr:sensor domain-containing diguanylate cyclase [Sulfurovum sp.]MCO4845235.1 sensor domain-containing diguanylate cyclase [Sulfurovum sp.]
MDIQKKKQWDKPADIVHVPEDVDRITTDIISSVEKFGKWNGEVKYLHKDGHIGWLESMCVPILDDNNQMIGALGINRDITARVEETKRLHDRAHYDELTQLPNRYLLLDRLNHLIERSERNKSTFALFYIDLDRFKDINDSKGHASGDKVLKEIASRLSLSIRSSDTVARIGGDEFIVILENTSDKDDISKMAETIIKEISEPCSIDGEEFQISCSVGIATYPKNGTTTDALLLYADKCMYKAKRKERGTYHF